MTAVIGTVVAIGIAAVDGTEAATGTVVEEIGIARVIVVRDFSHEAAPAMARTANKTDNFELRNAAKFAAFLLLYQVKPNCYLPARGGRQALRTQLPADIAAAFA
jgi:hypothetical protein